MDWSSSGAILSIIQSPTTSIHHLHQIHALLLKTHHYSSPPPQLTTRLVSSIALRHPIHLPYALSIFSRLPSPHIDLFTLNSLILGFLRSSSPHLALSFFALHCRRRAPNAHTFPPILKACSQLRCLSLGLALHAYVVKLGLNCNLHIHTALLSLYSSLGDFASARKLFDEIPHRGNVAAWNAIISGLVKGGKSRDGLDLFYEIVRGKEVDPDEFTIASVLAACADLGALNTTRWVHEYAVRNGFEANVYVGTALVDAYAKCGSIDVARKLFNEMRERNVMTWTAMIHGLAMFGRGDEVLRLFDDMVGLGLVPDDVTLIGVLSACSHSGMVDEGRRVFSTIAEPKLEHYGSMVDLLSRQGLLNEALDLIETMPMKADAAIWGSLLSACRRDPKNMDMAEYVAGQLMKIEPNNESAYILLSNIYAYHNRWDDVVRLRTRMKARGMEKNPGCSSIEINGAVHEFIVGDKSHPQIDEMLTMLMEIEYRVGKMGHAADTTELLLDIEDDKEENIVAS